MNSRYSTKLSDVLTKPAVAEFYLQILGQLSEYQQLYGIFHCEDNIGRAIKAVDVQDLITVWGVEEARVKHETAGFVAALRMLLVAEFRPYVYLGLTSSDLIDTTAALQWKRIWHQHLLPDMQKLTGDLIVGSQMQDQLRYGRTHGRLAEPVPIGAPYARAARDLSNAVLDLTRDHYIPGKLSGPVGEYNEALRPEVINGVAHQLGIQLDPNASQIVDRHFYRRVAGDLIEVVAICEQLATLHRLSAIEGVDLFAEGFDEGKQKGSSIMPYKRNPVRSERICGLARVARGNYAALLETWSTSWWERSLDNSSVERTAWWDLVQLTHYLVRETRAVVQEGHWRPDLPADFQSTVDELVLRQSRGEDPESTYREIQAR